MSAENPPVQPVRSIFCGMEGHPTAIVASFRVAKYKDGRLVQDTLLCRMHLSRWLDFVMAHGEVATIQVERLR